MITAIVGHRGTGKTELLRRLKLYIRDEATGFMDLDLEIEKKIGKGIRELFLEHGEAYFREMERQVFLELLQQPYKNIFIVLGAGFDLNVIPETVKTLWVRRRTDHDGRIFLNRPRLEPDLTPLAEFHKRAQVREQRYRERADEVYLMPEGVFENHHHAMEIEKAILTQKLNDIDGGITILPSTFKNEFRWQSFVQRFKGRKVSFFELRDDFLTPEQIRMAFRDLAGERVVFSLRRLPYSNEFFDSPDFSEFSQNATWVDWAWELGSPELLIQKLAQEKIILSLHDRTQFSAASQFENRVGHFKYAPLISSFAELVEGHQWQQQKHQDARSFLPRSDEGRWHWYRLMQKGRQRMNFIKEDDGSAPDQPSLFAWLMQPAHATHFAAVLGDPVHHSFTPLEHSDFFHKCGMPVFAVQIHRDEFTGAIKILRDLGLTHAAVTAPHKENAGQLLNPVAEAVNTLLWDAVEGRWHGTSTDAEGFLELIEGVGMIAPLQNEIVVWGGGGTLSMLKHALPHAIYYSSRTGKPRLGSEHAEGMAPKILIWAAPRSAETVLPPDSWNPAMIYDLNYKEDSLGREYAQLKGMNYQSGLVMFHRQAQGQRLFWRKHQDATKQEQP